MLIKKPISNRYSRQVYNASDLINAVARSYYEDAQYLRANIDPSLDAVNELAAESKNYKRTFNIIIHYSSQPSSARGVWTNTRREWC